MIDSHSHILPGIDDGSGSVEVSIEMLRKEIEADVLEVFMTPHFYHDGNTVENFLEKRNLAFNRLMDACSNVREGKNSVLKLPRIRLGAEVAFFYGISKLEDVEKLCIDGTNLLLLELPYEKWDNRVIWEIKMLENNYDINIILAHFERFVDFKSNHEYIKTLLSSSFFIQVNADSFLDRERRKVLKRWLRSGNVDFIGSDAHDSVRRPPLIHDACDRIIKMNGVATIIELEKKMENLMKKCERE